MNIKRCFEILELNPNASMDEAKQAYKDLANIWHPDRFSRNPRLKQRAERKLKEINEAYETVKSFLSSKPEQGKGRKKASHTQAQSGTEAKAGDDNTEAKTRTEAAVEAGTFAVLSLWSYLSTKLRGLVTEQVHAFKEGEKTDSQETKQGRDRGKDEGKGGAGRNANLRG